MHTLGANYKENKKKKKRKGNDQLPAEWLVFFLLTAYFSALPSRVCHFHSSLASLILCKCQQTWIFAFLISEAPSNFTARPYADKIRLTWSPYGTVGKHGAHLFYKLYRCQANQTDCEPTRYTPLQGGPLLFDFDIADSIPDELSVEACNRHRNCSERAKLSK